MRSRGVQTAVAFVSLLTCHYVLAEQIAMDATVELPELGIRFAPFVQIPMQPKPTGSSTFLTFERGGTSTTIEAYALDELWHLDQLHALFTNRLGRVRIAEIVYPKPILLERLNDDFVTREEMNRARREQKITWSLGTLQTWVENFTGKKVLRLTSVGRGLSLRYPCKEVEFASERQGTKAYLMKIKHRGQVRYVLFMFEWSGVRLFDNEDVATVRCLRSVTSSTVRQSAKRVNMRHQKLSSLAQHANVSREFQRTKQRVIENINAVDDWWYVEMPHYILVSNLTRKNRALVTRIQEDIETLRDAFKILIPPVTDIKEVSVVRVFNTREQYVDYVGRNYQWTLGMWVPGKKELVVSPAGGRDHKSKGSTQKEQILGTAYHEAFHQYVHYALHQTQLPVWLNEGHACLFEASKFSRARTYVTVNENQDREQTLVYARELGYETDIVEIMSLSRSQFYVEEQGGEQDEFARSFHYASAWAITYFLRKASPILFPGKGYDKIPARMVDFLLDHEGDFEGALRFALEGIDDQELQGNYDKFWRNKSMRNKAKKNHLFRPTSLQGT